jgi:hypothetical protein
MKILREKICNMKDLFIFKNRENITRYNFENKEPDINSSWVNKHEEKKLNDIEKNYNSKYESIKDKNIEINKIIIDQVIFKL